GMGFARHGSRRPPLGPGRHHEPANVAPVELEGDQRRGAVAGEAVILPLLGREVLQLLRGWRLGQPALRLERTLVALVGVQPVVRLREADGAIADPKKAGRLSLRPAHGMPAALEEEYAAPGAEPAR